MMKTTIQLVVAILVITILVTTVATAVIYDSVKTVDQPTAGQYLQNTVMGTELQSTDNPQ